MQRIALIKEGLMDIFQAVAKERRIIAECLLTEHENRYQMDYIEQKPRVTDELDLSRIARDKTCCFTGHRPEKLQRPYEECIASLCKAIMDAYEAGYRIYVCGMARGTDLWALHCVLMLRSLYPEVRVIAAIPFEGFEKSWDALDREMYHAFVCQADIVHTVTTMRSRRTFQMHNVWMCDVSSRLIALWDGEKGGTANTIAYAKRKKLEIILL